MCLAQSDHPRQCWKDLQLAESLHLCESVVRGAFPPFSNPPTSHFPPNILPTPNPPPISQVTILQHIVSGEAPLGLLVEKDANCDVLISEMRSLPAKRQKEPIFPRKIPADQEALLKNQEKARYQRN
jgi:hypothetical protein